MAGRHIERSPKYWLKRRDNWRHRCQSGASAGLQKQCRKQAFDNSDYCVRHGGKSRVISRPTWTQIGAIPSIVLFKCNFCKRRDKIEKSHKLHCSIKHPVEYARRFDNQNSNEDERNKTNGENVASTSRGNGSVGGGSSRNVSASQVSKRPYGSSSSKPIGRGSLVRSMVQNTKSGPLCDRTFGAFNNAGSHRQPRDQPSTSVRKDPRQASVSRVSAEQPRSSNGRREHRSARVAVEELHVEEEAVPDQQEQEPREQNDSLEARAIVDANDLAQLRTELAAALTELAIVKADRDRTTTENTRLTDEALRGEEERHQLQNTIAELTAQRNENRQNAEERRQAHEAAAGSLGEVEKRCQSQETELRALRDERNADVDGRRQTELERVKCDMEHKKAIKDLIESHDRALQQQKHDLEKRCEEAESQLAEMRRRHMELEKAKEDALKRSNKFRAALDEKDGLVRYPTTEEKSRNDLFKEQWNDDEKRIFKEHFGECDKDFVKLSSFLERKSTKDCVQYYYFTKERRSKPPQRVQLGKVAAQRRPWQKKKNEADVPVLKSKSLAVLEYGE